MRRSAVNVIRQFRAIQRRDDKTIRRRETTSYAKCHTFTYEIMKYGVWHIAYEKTFLWSSGRPVNMRFVFTKFIPLMAGNLDTKAARAERHVKMEGGIQEIIKSHL